jgi:hypothetical protein
MTGRASPSRRREPPRTTPWAALPGRLELLTSPVERCRSRPARLPAGRPSPLALRRARRPRRQTPRTPHGHSSTPLRSPSMPARPAQHTSPRHPQQIPGQTAVTINGNIQPGLDKLPLTLVSSAVLRFATLRPIWPFPGGGFRGIPALHGIKTALTGSFLSARRRSSTGRHRPVPALRRYAELPDEAGELQQEREPGHAAYVRYSGTLT